MICMSESIDNMLFCPLTSYTLDSNRHNTFTFCTYFSWRCKCYCLWLSITCPVLQDKCWYLNSLSHHTQLIVTSMLGKVEELLGPDAKECQSQHILGNLLLCLWFGQGQRRFLDVNCLDGVWESALDPEMIVEVLGISSIAASNLLSNQLLFS